MDKTKVIKENAFKEEIKIEALSEKNWQKFIKLFGERGACGSC